ncbi:MAG: hypothetical protein NTY60_09615, partial [Proteobacteria bacterium]|nr:hypothetical protein [Pseudomonadota bacterium]
VKQVLTDMEKRPNLMTEHAMPVPSPQPSPSLRARGRTNLDASLTLDDALLDTVFDLVKNQSEY